MKSMADKVEEMFNPLVTRWSELPDRDRFALSALLCFIGIAAIYFLLWSPLHQWSEQSQLNYKSQQSLVAWIKQNRETFIAAKRGGSQGGEAARGGRSVLSLVNQESRRQTLNIKRIEPKNNGELRVWVDGVKFNSLITLMEVLSRRYGIELVTLNLEQGKEPGLVNASLVLGG